jgi:hypothetical protein
MIPPQAKIIGPRLKIVPPLDQIVAPQLKIVGPHPKIVPPQRKIIAPRVGKTHFHSEASESSGPNFASPPVLPVYHVSVIVCQ